MMLRIVLTLTLLTGAAQAQMNSFFPGPGTAHSTSSLDPDTVAWVNAVAGGSPAGTVTAPRQTIVNTFITCVKAAGIWKTDTGIGFDRYWLLAGEDEGSSIVDIVNLQPLTRVGSPVHAPSVGYTFATLKYLNSNYNPSIHGSNYSQNSATVGGQVQNNRTTGLNEPIWGAANGAFDNISSLLPYTTALGSEVKVNSNGANGDVGATAKGSWISTRTGASAGQLYYFITGNASGTGFPAVAISQSSTGGSPTTPNSVFFIGALAQGGTPVVYNTTDQMSSFYLAGGWNSTRAQAFEVCQNNMMTSIGINVH